MSPFKNASLPLQTNVQKIHPRKSSNSLHINNSFINDSKISVDSDTGTAIPDINPPFTLRVVNPDFYEEDNEPVHSANIQYKPTLNTSALASPELKNVAVQPVVVVPPPTNSWQSNSKQDGSPLPTSTSDYHHSQLQQPVIRKTSKTLVEQEPYQFKKNKELELLPPLKSLPPLLTMNESHLLSPASESASEATPIISNNNHKVMESLQTTLASSPISTSPTSPKAPPPQLPQHHSDFLASTSGKASPSIAQQSINAAVLIAKPEHLPKSPNGLDENELNHNERLELAIDGRRQSRDLLTNESSSARAVHTRNPSSTPSFTPSHMQQSANSRYAKASFSLTNHPDAIKLYRTMALKTKDPTVQLTYAKYLLEVASLYDEKKRPFRPNLSLSLPLLKRPGNRRNSNASNRPSSIASSRRSSLDTHVSLNTTNLNNLNPMRRDSVMTQTCDENEEASKRKKRKMLEEEGVRWIKRLAKEHVGEAAYLLALWYDRGMYGFRKSSSKALKFYEIAATNKVPEAMFAVGQYHEREQDYMTSFQLYEDAASLGLVEAFYRIAMINLNGEFGSRRNTTAAIQLLMKASEKSTGSCPEAPYALGLLLLNDYPSINIPSELIQTYGGTFAATTYLEYAAEMGLSAAQYRLGHIYEHGLYNIRVNLVKAFNYYELAANTNNNVYAMLGLSRLYNQGIRVPAEQLDDQVEIFERDESGWTRTRPRDEDAAFKWCHVAADQGLSDACYLLGWYYEMGIGVPRDYAQAYHYYSKASKKGHHKEAKNRVDLLESLVKYQKHQKNEKRHTMMQDKKLSAMNRGSTSRSSHRRDSQCNIM